MSEREVFEVWLKSELHGLSLNLDKSAHETYNSTVVHWAWQSWQASAANQQARIEFLEKALGQAIDKGGITIEDWESWGGKGLYLRAFGHPESAEMYPELAAYLKEKR